MLPKNKEWFYHLENRSQKQKEFDANFVERLTKEEFRQLVEDKHLISETNLCSWQDEGLLNYEVIPYSAEHNHFFIGFFVIALKDGFLSAPYCLFDPLQGYELFQSTDLEDISGERVLELADDLKDKAKRIETRLAKLTFPAILSKRS